MNTSMLALLSHPTSLHHHITTCLHHESHMLCAADPDADTRCNAHGVGLIADITCSLHKQPGYCTSDNGPAYQASCEADHDTRRWRKVDISGDITHDGRDRRPQINLPYLLMLPCLCLCDAALTQAAIAGGGGGGSGGRGGGGAGAAAPNAAPPVAAAAAPVTAPPMAPAAPSPLYTPTISKPGDPLSRAPATVLGAATPALAPAPSPAGNIPTISKPGDPTTPPCSSSRMTSSMMMGESGAAAAPSTAAAPVTVGLAADGSCARTAAGGTGGGGGAAAAQLACGAAWAPGAMLVVTW
eukprot:CAMPEP_0202873684 /NCGR_PEP_ID=MMETSP1391-20130828/23741_1 /ASSEMBLY_ACC=CAM_ASM_000867 /TAXON_ID=1034604 /ORGANISM="Chlamydomonas leiostraca, Strain SAG 11-49" /LENGTH=297 /DNA_ID=CAMNT_0049554947 /DNA_START=222 /DNA_END=1117 /DNA_ORIENTATION=+